MKYLPDNKFKVITISDLTYSEKDDYLYVKDLELESELVAENVTTPAVEPTANVMTIVTTPMIAPEGNPILEALKNLFGLR